MIELINKKKIQADDYISISLIVSYITFALFFRLEAILSIMIYPLTALFVFGVLKIINASKKRDRGGGDKVSKIIKGIAFIIFSFFFLFFFLTQPNVTPEIILNLIAFPIAVVGIAGIVKGKLVTIYLKKYRIMNMVIGGITIGICTFTFISPRILSQTYFLFHIISLAIILTLNILGRAALYLSEFGLSLWHLRNFKLFLYIISDYLVHIDRNGNLVLNKIE